MEKNNKIFLRADGLKWNRIHTAAVDFCAIVNGKVLPALAQLEMPVTHEKVIYYALDSERVYKDYTQASMKGCEKLSAVARDVVKERIQENLYSALGDGWGEPYCNDDVLCILRWQESTPEEIEDGKPNECIVIDDGVLNELCAVYVEPEQENAYHELEHICDLINKVMRYKSPNFFVDGLPFVCVDGRWKVSSMVNLNYFV